ncbi:hypothetical protein [Micromonospora sp. NPDC005203]|uniref:hypothetical protein n=1 Tax=Micromonospora sp. NPDC005203 TaxID=3364226 RepID=UPI00367F7BE3
MTFGEGGVRGAALGLGRRLGWWILPLKLVVAVGVMHLMAIVLTLLFPPPPGVFSLRGFALTWVLMAAFASLAAWWERRNRRRRREPSGRRWRDDAPRWLVQVEPVVGVVWIATSFSAYLAALNGELTLLGAGTLSGLAFAPMATVGFLAERHESRDDPAFDGE